MTMWVTLAFRVGSTILVYDDRNAFDSLYRSSILWAVAETASELAQYTDNLYTRAPPKLLFCIENGTADIVQCARRV